jgi:agmatinase
MPKLLLSNSNSISSADFIIVGVPDESKSHAKRSGTSKGPDVLRTKYNDSQYFERGHKKIPITPMAGSIYSKRIFDVGNVVKKNYYKLIYDICTLKKIPISLGGDHSLTTLALKALNDSLGKKISLLYFDAHPDFVTSTQDYYGSVLSDAKDSIDFKKSLLIGTRAAEPEELENILNSQLECITPLEIVEKGISSIVDRILTTCTEEDSVYVSIDLDCIDPGIAPGVSVPTSCGLSPLELVFLVKKVCSNRKIIGQDIVELCPDYDLNLNTAEIGARLLMESVASIQM